MFSALKEIPDWNATFDNTNSKLSLTDLSNILWAGQGENRPGRRTTPSAGATYPMDLYVAYYDGISDSKGLVGLYKPSSHAIDPIVSITNENELKNLNNYPGSVKLILTSTESRTSLRYGDRARQYINLEIGHVLENIRLEAWSRNIIIRIYIINNNSKFLDWVPDSSQIEVIICLVKPSSNNNNPSNKIQALNVQSITQGSSVESVMEKRSSIRDYQQRNISSSEFDSLILTAFDPISEAYKTNNSLFGQTENVEKPPTSIKIVTSERIINKTNGIYEYNYISNNIELIKSGYFLSDLKRESLNQEFIESSSFSIIIEMDNSLTSNEKKIAMFEAGILAQRLYHSSFLHNFGMVVVGAFSDTGVANVVISDNKIPLYVIPIGPINIEDTFSSINLIPQNIRFLGSYFGYFSLLLFLISGFVQNSLIMQKLHMRRTTVHKKIIYLALASGILHILCNYGYYFLTKLLSLEVVTEFLLGILLPPEIIPTSYESLGQSLARFSVIVIIITIVTLHPKKYNKLIITYVQRLKIHKLLFPIYITLAIVHGYLNSLLFTNKIEFFLLILIGASIWVVIKGYERFTTKQIEGL